jgi:hypothetical protein
MYATAGVPLRSYMSVVRLYAAKWHRQQQLQFYYTANRFGDGRLHSVRRLSSGNVQRDEYDYIVVGAGSAGCVVANRLVLGDIKAKVLITEAGPPADQSLIVRMPAGVIYTFSWKKTNWSFQTTPQVRCWNNLIQLHVMFVILILLPLSQARAVNTVNKNGRLLLLKPIYSMHPTRRVVIVIEARVGL